MIQKREVARAEILAAVRQPVWHMMGQESQSIVATANAAPMSFMYDDDDDPDDGNAYELTDTGVAIFNITGPVVSAEPTWWMQYCGYVSLPQLTRDFMAAAADENVKSALLNLKSPGGHVMGLYAACNAVASIKAAGKTVYATCSMACSAAYEIASQADKIYLTPDGMAGCIGTMMDAEDWSKYYQKLGVEVFVIASDGGETYKGEGAEGAPLTAAQRADYKRMCNEYRSLFNDVILRGRPALSKTLLALADGRTHIGRNALALGLVDAIATPDEVLAALGGGPPIAEDAFPPPDIDLDDDEPEDSARQKPPVNQSRNPEPAPTSGAGSNSVMPGRAERTTKMNLRETLSQKLTAFGLHGMASKVIQTNSEDQDTIASALAASVNDQVTAKVDVHPLIMACRENGVNTADDIKALISARNSNVEILAAARTSAKASAIAALGQDLGAKIGNSVDHLNYSDTMAMKASWDDMEGATFNRPANGAAPARATVAPDMDDEFKGLPNAESTVLKPSDYFANINGAKGAK